MVNGSGTKKQVEQSSMAKPLIAKPTSQKANPSKPIFEAYTIHFPWHDIQLDQFIDKLSWEKILDQ